MGKVAAPTKRGDGHQKLWMSYEFFIARRYFESKRKKGFISLTTYISIGGVLVGVSALTIVLSVMNGFEIEVRDRIVSADAHIRLLTSDNQGIRDYQSLVHHLRQRKHVVAVAPFVYGESMVTSAGRSAGARIMGMDPQGVVGVTDLEKNIRYGELAFEVSSPKGSYPGAMLGVTLADRLRVGVGDKVMVISPQGIGSLTPWFSPGAREFVVTALFETGLYDYDASLAYISLESAQSLFQMGDAVTGIGLKVDDIYSAQGVAQKITRELGYPFLALSWMEQNKTLFNWMTIEKWAMFLILSLIILVAAFNIASTLIMVVMERTKEIGILKSMGATAKGIMKIFMLEGLVVGAVGTVLGCVLGYGLCWVQETFKILSLPSEIYFIDALPIEVRVTDFLWISAAAMAICFLATVYPARKAAALEPVEAIRYE